VPFVGAQAPAKPVELSGKATDFYFTKNYNSYYWREDFSQVLVNAAGRVLAGSLSLNPPYCQNNR